MGFLDKLGFGKSKDTQAAAPKEMAPVNEARAALLSKREALMKDLTDFKKNNFGGGIPAKIKELQKQVDSIDKELIATLPTPESAIARSESIKSADDLIDRRMVEKPDAMKEQEAKAAERQSLKEELAALRQREAKINEEMENAKQNLQKQQNIVDDQRLGFGGAKKVGSVAEGAVGIDQSYISDLENEQIALLKRKVEISEKLSQ